LELSRLITESRDLDRYGNIVQTRYKLLVEIENLENLYNFFITYGTKFEKKFTGIWSPYQMSTKGLPHMSSRYDLWVLLSKV